MIRLTDEQGLMTMYRHYGSEITKECNNVEFRRSVGVVPTEESVAKTNEKLYQLFMFRNNIANILERAEDEDDEEIS